MKQTSDQTIKLKQASVQKLSENLALIKISDHAYLETEDIEEILKARTKFFDDKPYFVVSISGRYSNISKEARDLASSEKYMHNIQKLGIVVNTLGARIMGNFFIKIKKTKTPCRLFNFESQAISWVLQSEN